MRDVMIGGRFVLRDGVLPGLDWPSIAARARDAAARLAAANAGARDASERLAPVVSHFCVGLGRCAHDLPRRLLAEAVNPRFHRLCKEYLNHVARSCDLS